MTHELVAPRGALPGGERRLARRRGSMDAVRILGFLSNEAEHMSGPHFPRYTRVMEQIFRKRFSIDDVVHETKPVLSRPATTETLERFREGSEVVNGLAKRGSGSSGRVLVAGALVAKGLPTVPVGVP